jgi:hypothetical protein
MTVFCSHHGRPHEAAAADRSWSRQVKRLRTHMRRMINRMIATLGSRGEWSSKPAAHRGLGGDPAKLPRRPMVLGDKWDF